MIIYLVRFFDHNGVQLYPVKHIDARQSIACTSATEALAYLDLLGKKMSYFEPDLYRWSKRVVRKIVVHRVKDGVICPAAPSDIWTV
jgi:hypothetical protein